MQISYTPHFVRMFQSLPTGLQAEVADVIETFRDKSNHVRLKVHKLKGRLSGSYAFSVNYQTRIVFQYEKGDDVILTAIGDHDIYRL